MPFLRALLICDEVVQRADTQFNLIGVKRVFTIPTFPAKGRFTVFSIIDEMPPGPTLITVRFEERGITLAAFQQPASIHLEFDGKLNHVYQVFADFDSVGDYTLIYLINDIEIGRLPFTVEQSLE